MRVVVLLDSLVSVVSYWESLCSSKMSTSTRARAGPSITLLMFSRARANANRSPRPHADWSSKIAAEEEQKKLCVLFLLWNLIEFSDVDDWSCVCYCKKMELLIMIEQTSLQRMSHVVIELIRLCYWAHFLWRLARD